MPPFPSLSESEHVLLSEAVTGESLRMEAAEWAPGTPGSPSLRHSLPCRCAEVGGSPGVQASRRERGGHRSRQLPRLLLFSWGPTASVKCEATGRSPGSWCLETGPQLPASSREQESGHTCAGERSGEEGLSSPTAQTCSVTRTPLPQALTLVLAVGVAGLSSSSDQ